MSGFGFSEEFYLLDFTHHGDKLRDDSQYVNNQCNITDRSKSVTDFLGAKIGLKEMKIRSPDNLTFGHVNKNSIRNKSDSLRYMPDKNVNIPFISVTKLDDSFLLIQFKIEDFNTPYKYDRNDKGDDLLLHIREDIPLRLLQCASQCNIESLSAEVNLRKRKWFLNCSKNPH